MNRYLFLAPALAALALSSCAKVQNAEAPITTPSEGITATIQKPLPAEGFGEGTKALNGNFEFEFTKDDKFLIANASSSTTSMNYGVTVKQEDKKQCEVNIEGFTPNDGTYGALYPNKAGLSLTDLAAIPFTLAGQTQNGNNNTAHLADYDCNVATAGITSCQGNFNLARQVCWLKINFTCTSDEKVTKVTLKASDNRFAQTLFVNVPNGTVTPSDFASEMVLNVSGATASTSYTGYLTLAGDVNLKGVSVIVLTDKAEYQKTIDDSSDKILNAGNFATLSSFTASTKTKLVSNNSEFSTAISTSSVEKIILNSDVTYSGVLNLNKDIDLNQKTLTVNVPDKTKLDTYPDALVVSDKVNISNGTLTGSCGYNLITVHTNGNLTMTNVTSSVPYRCVYPNQSGAVATLINCSLSNTDSGTYTTESDKWRRCAVAVASNATVNIQSGVYTGYYYAVSITSSGGSVYISGGTFNQGASGYCLLTEGRKSDAKGTYNISGNPTLYGGVRGQTNNQNNQFGYVNISGGTFVSPFKLDNFDTADTATDSYGTRITLSPSCGYKLTSNGKTSNAFYWFLEKDIP